jgi:hypothetical protein
MNLLSSDSSYHRNRETSSKVAMLVFDIIAQPQLRKGIQQIITMTIFLAALRMGQRVTIKNPPELRGW